LVKLFLKAYIKAYIKGFKDLKGFKEQMRNHVFVNEVATKMIEYNHNEYLIDLDELISLNQFGNALTNLISQIKNVLSTGINNVNQNQFQTAMMKNNLKTYIYQMLIFNDGYRCCKKLICEE
jgi:hypothetical protein